MKHRSDAISKLLEGLDTIVAGHAKRTLEEDKGKQEQSEGEQPIESTKEYVEKYEVEADLPEGHSEEAEEAGAERAEKGPDTEMPEYPGVEEAEHGRAKPKMEAAGEGSGMPMAKPRDERHEKRSEPEDEMSQAKKELMDRLSRKPKAIRR
jgi:hypothetical protein